MAENNWYKQISVYQLWTRSFCDGNGDGIGDLRGVLEKLDYIKSLNVDAVRFSPIFPSPNADYGYDVSDYMGIAPEYGDLDVFRTVLNEAHKRDMRVFMDLVINHTSDEHFWFKEGKKSVTNPYHDYYCWSPARYIGKKRLPPNSLTGQTDGEFWEYDSDLDEYYLYLFSAKQPRLNLKNHKVRSEIKKIMRFWLDMGVDGFCEDVISYSSKTSTLPLSFPALTSGSGMKRYSDMSEIHGYLREFKRDVLDCYDCFVLGESPLITADAALEYVSERSEKVLDEMTAFEPMHADFNFNSLFPRPFSLKKMKKTFTEWQTKLEGNGWNALYIENRSLPRSISRCGSELYRTESGKMLAAMYILQKGTPFIYQGQEIGMLNIALPRLEMYRDPLTFSFAKAVSKIVSKEKVLKLIYRTSRDNARTPMQWSSGRNAGFSAGVPWFSVNPNYLTINVAAEEKNPDSVLNFYRRLLKFKKENPVALYGSYRELLPDSSELYVYERVLNNERLLVICSFTNRQVRFESEPEYDIENAEPVLSNYEHNFVIANGFTTRPYEMRVYHFK